MPVHVATRNFPCLNKQDRDTGTSNFPLKGWIQPRSFLVGFPVMVVNVCLWKLMADEANKTPQEPMANQHSWYFPIVIMSVATWAKTRYCSLFHLTRALGAQRKAGEITSWFGSRGGGRRLFISRDSLWDAQPWLSTKEASRGVGRKTWRKGKWSFSFTSSRMEAHNGLHWANQGLFFLLRYFTMSSAQAVFLTLQMKRTHGVHGCSMLTAL